jgi:hypothetical protein
MDRRTNEPAVRNVVVESATEPTAEDGRKSPPPDYEESVSANSLYCASSRTKSQSPAEMYTPQIPTQKSTQASFLPPLPPRPASF